MSEWQDISTAPKDGTIIRARIPGHGDDNLIAWHDGFMAEDDEPCGAWEWMEEGDPPECWTDGVCWQANERGEQSVLPTHWLPAKPTTGE